jgi:hypothetical protein
MDLDRIREGTAALEQLEALASVPDPRPALIRSARSAGFNWETVAEAAGVSRSTAINLSKVDS